MMRIWMLSQGYECPERSAFHQQLFPVCSAYGYHYRYAVPLITPDDWQLVQIDTTPLQIEAAKQDPRIIVCGKDYDTPPAKVMEIYKDWLDPNTTYMFMGQVIAKLAQTNLAFYHEF
jgi:hypothetical protein